MKKRTLSIILTTVTALSVLAGCGKSAGDKAEAAATVADEVADATEEVSDDAVATSDASEGETVVLKGIVDLVPHSEIIEYVKPKLAEQGIEIDLVATAADSTTNEKLNAGEIDFNYFQHDPYLQSEIEANGYDLVDAGDIHVEPITAYSDKYTSKDEIKDGDVVAIPNDATNEYRALRILEQNGFIKLADGVEDSLSASVSDIEEYTVQLEIVELDSAQIIPTKDDYDFFITNTNKALEAGIDSARLFSEGADSPYANIIAVRTEDKDNPAIQALVAALLDEDTQKFIEDKYNGAVIPVK
ncbi:MetQ/NlpA family ABC transporter substrate-binding protein [Butyrivibrio sp. AE3006]|uniref:MetQ/NlpA family ABC transporter substrate-binding protein n=1 Tax=Butyrivibrio sp. AE3006 TaxID=1280673 RepID=UPI000416A44A|nr:MetQ/NlpA family ABC transporter substrate-binding protein [Butyrivibrio sp. AE3006]